MDDDGNDFFGLVQYSNDEEESASANAASDSESTSAITTTTKQSNAVTECTDMKDAKSVNPESVATDQDQEEYVEKNRVLLQLKEASETLSPVEYTRKKCMLSTRFHPVKVESIMDICAKKMGVDYVPQRKDAIAIAGMAKLYVRDLIAKAKELQDKDSTIIAPDSLRRAAKIWRLENRDMLPSSVCCIQTNTYHF